MGRRASLFWPGFTALASALVLAGCALDTRTGATSYALERGPDGACAPARSTPTQHLRRLSFDLRGGPPTREELARVVTERAVPGELVDAMLRSEGFLEQVSQWHRASLWPNLDELRVSGALVAAFDPRPQRGWEGEWYSPEGGLVGAAASMHPNGVVAMGDTHGAMSHLRGSDYPQAQRCDGNLRYPDPAPAGSAQPTYQTMGSDGVTRTYPYYDRDGVPLPYHDATHCANYCRRGDEYRAMDAAGAASPPHELDPRGFHCPDGFERVVNSCDRNPPRGGQPDEFFGKQLEGYRLVRHYWSEGRAVRTCAYEAQERVTGLRGQPCAGQLRNFDHDPSCGCGPNGAYCTPAVPDYNTLLSTRSQHLLRTALNEEPLRILRSVIERGESYFEVFRTRRAFVTGALSFMYRDQAGAVATSGGERFSAPAPRERIPELAFDDTSWREYERDPQHAGVLTTPVYLLRFPTRRARVAQFRTAFLCRSFAPVTSTLPPPNDPCVREPDLARRCGCQHCHSAIEPMGAYWGRFVERSAEFLSPTAFPQRDPGCTECAAMFPPHPTNEVGQRLCNDRCRTYYLLDRNEHGPRAASQLGMLSSLLYRAEDEYPRIEEGPRALVDASIATGELSACTVRTAWGRLLNRPMTETEARTVLPELQSQWAAARYDYRALVRAIVLSDAYQRVD